MICDDHIDSTVAEYDASSDLEHRSELIKELQEYILDEDIFFPVYINSFAMGAGPKIKGDVTNYTKVYNSLYPYEDIEINP